MDIYVVSISVVMNSADVSIGIPQHFKKRGLYRDDQLPCLWLYLSIPILKAVPELDSTSWRKNSLESPHVPI